jgi:hypothetical protein
MPATADEKATLDTLVGDVAAIKAQIALIGKACWIFVASVVVLILSAFYAAHTAGQIRGTLVAVQATLGEMRADFKQTQKNLADLMAESKAQSGQLKRILARTNPGRPR